MTRLEVLTRLLYYLFQGRVVVSSHSSFIHYIEVELVLSAFKRTLVYYPYCQKFTLFKEIFHLMNIIIVNYIINIIN